MRVSEKLAHVVASLRDAMRVFASANLRSEKLAYDEVWDA
jgi:hypothetical protein